MIVYCCPDLLFATRIRSTAQAMSIPTRPARDAAALQARLDRVDDGKGNDPVSGVIVDLDLGEAGLALIEQTKHHAAGVAVAAYGSHVATDMLERARTSGADFVMPRGAFVASMPVVLERLRGSETVQGSKFKVQGQTVKIGAIRPIGPPMACGDLFFNLER